MMTYHILIFNKNLKQLNKTFEYLNIHPNYNILNAGSGEMASQIIEKKNLHIIILEWETIISSNIDILKNIKINQDKAVLIVIINEIQLKKNEDFVREKTSYTLNPNFSKEDINTLIVNITKSEERSKKNKKSKKVSEKDKALQEQIEDIEKEKKNIKKEYKKIKQEKEELKIQKKELEEDKKDLTKQQERLTKDENKFLAKQLELEKKGKKISKATEKLSMKQSAKYEVFLTHILPFNIRQELDKAEQKSIQLYPEISVLVLHWYNINYLKTHINTNIIIQELERLSEEFEKKRFTSGLEKIKTNGLDYVLIQGINDEKHNPHKLISIAKRFKNIIDAYQNVKKSKQESYLYATISIQTGQLIAGTVNNQPFAFDIWREITQRIIIDKLFNETPILISENTVKHLDKTKVKTDKIGSFNSKQYGKTGIFSVL